MIEKITNYNNKSFKNYTNPDNLKFKQKNIIFGYNGAGKSTLSDAIKKEFLKDSSKKENNLRLFNRDYIEKLLVIENDVTTDKIKGVIANFGTKDIEIEKEIKKIENEIFSEEELSKIKKEIQTLQETTRQEIDLIHDRKKGKAKIQKKDGTKNSSEVIELYERDYGKAKNFVTNDDELVRISGDNTIENKINFINKLKELNFSGLNIKEDELTEAFENILKKDIEIPSYEIIKWLQEGVHIHKDGDKCKFCGGELKYQSIKERIKQYSENKKHKAEELFRNLQEQLENSKKEIDEIYLNKQIYSLSLENNDIEKIFDNIRNIRKEIENFLVSLQNLNKDIIPVFKKLNTSVLVVQQNVQEIIDIKKKKLKELYEQQNKLDTLVKGAIYLEIKKNPLISSNIKKIDEKQKNLDLKIEFNKKKRNKIIDLKKTKSPTGDFANFVTQVLQDMNINLKIELDTNNNDYIIKSTNENINLKIKDISEGEKNLLVILFFYYELFDDNKQQNIKNEIELIVIDDPISSLDDSNKFYILEIMRIILKLSDQQVFILTHSWNDFCNISYGKEKDEQKNILIEVKKKNGESYLEKLNNNIKPYKYLFKEIYEFSKKSIGDYNNCEIFHYPNVMRRIFEEWYAFKTGVHFNLTESMIDRLANDFQISDFNDKIELGKLLKVCNILSHFINESLNPQEIHQASKYLMKIIKIQDKLHFDKMKE